MKHLGDEKEAFIRFTIECDVLRFGEFVLKSGRVSPYFFNSGLFDTGAKLARLAGYYAAAIEASKLEYDMLYGAAYKGIPLVAAVAVSLSRDFGRDAPYCFNRKELKDHGEGGATVGAELRGRVVIVDDVVSAGTSVNESVRIIRAAGATPVAVAVSLDRQERGPDQRSAIQAIEEDLGLKVVSLVSLDDMVAFLQADPANRAVLNRVLDYRQRFGTAAST